MSTWDFAFTGAWAAWAVMAFAAVCAALAYVFYRSKRNQLRRPWFRALALLRTAVIVIVALFLLKPVIRYSRTSLQDSSVLVLQDVSESMGIPDSAGGLTRLAAGVELLRGDGGILPQIAESHEVEYFTFGAFIAKKDPSDEITAHQKATAIGDALQEAVGRAGEEGLAGVVLLTDGVSTTGEDPLRVARFLGVPVYPVVLGGKEQEKGRFYDVGIASTPHNLEFIVNNKATVRARLSNYGLKRFTQQERSIPLTLSRGQEKLGDKQVQFPSMNGQREVSVEYVPRQVGLHKLTVDLPQLDGEAVPENNSRTFTVRVTDPRLRTLLLEGVVRAEYKFLRRTLESDPNVDLTSVVKLRKDKFLHQGVDAGVDLSRGLPVTAEEFEKFDVIILSDIGRSEFSRIQLDLLEAWVADGSGVMTLGGYNSYGAGGYAGSPLATIIPLRIGGKTDGHAEERFAPRLLEAGRSHPVLDGCADFFAPGADRALLDGANRTAGPKPGATVLLVHPTEKVGDDPLPILASHQYGAGRALSLTADTTSKWAFQVQGRGLDSPYYRFWRQSVRWLAGRTNDDLRGDMLLAASPNKSEYGYEETVLVTAKVRRRDKQPNDNAQVVMTVQYPMPIQKVNPQGATYMESSIDVPLTHIPISLGQYRASFRPPVSGVYKAIVAASDDSGRLAETAFEFTVGRLVSEFDRIDVDELALRAVAGETGGECHTLATARRIPEELRKRQHRKIYSGEINLWNTPLFFLVFLACVTAEWALRKRHGLN